MLLKKSKVLALYKILITKLLVLELKKFPSIVLASNVLLVIKLTVIQVSKNKCSKSYTFVMSSELYKLYTIEAKLIIGKF